MHSLLMDYSKNYLLNTNAKRFVKKPTISNDLLKLGYNWAKEKKNIFQQEDKGDLTCFIPAHTLTDVPSHLVSFYLILCYIFHIR